MTQSNTRKKKKKITQIKIPYLVAVTILKKIM
jgi:hypothetical protein